MRTIKFRARRVDNHPVFWAYGHLVKTPITAEFNARPEVGLFFDSGSSGRYCIVTDWGVAHEVDITTIGQFTDLLDINEKEIYEGDIIKATVSDRHFGEVVYLDGQFVVRFFLDRSTMPLSRWYRENNKFAVVGNLYQNPELVESYPNENQIAD